MIEKQDIVTEFVDGEYYYWESTNHHGIHQQGSSNSMYLNDATYTISKVENIEDWSGATTRLATPEEKAHLKLCQEHGKYMPPPKLESVTDFVEGEYYNVKWSPGREVIYQQGTKQAVHLDYVAYSNQKINGLEKWGEITVRLATKLEKQHLQLCQIAGKYLPKPKKEVDFDLELAKYRVQTGDLSDAEKVLDCFVDNGYKKPSNYGHYVNEVCAAFEYNWDFKGNLCCGAMGDRPILSSGEFLEKFSKTKNEGWITEFVDGEYYHCTSQKSGATLVKAHGNTFATYLCDKSISYISSSIDQLNKSFKARKATKLEKQHAQLCEIYGQYIPMIEKELPFDLELAKYRVEGKSNEECKAIIACFAENGYDDWSSVANTKDVFAAYSYNGFHGTICSGYQHDDVRLKDKRLDIERPIISAQEFLAKFSKNPVVDGVASSEIENLKKQIADLTSELEDQEVLVAELDKRKSDLQAKLVDAATNYAKLEKNLALSSSNWNDMKDQRDDWKSKFEQSGKDHLQQVSELNELVSSVEGQLERERSTKEGAISAKDLMCVRYAKVQEDKSEIKARLASVLGDIDRVLSVIKTPKGKITIAGEEYKTKQTLFGKWLG